MEFLDLLEDRVRGLVQQRQDLREQLQHVHAASSTAVSGYAILVEENRQLREELARERRRVEDARGRAEALLRQLQDMENAV